MKNVRFSLSPDERVLVLKFGYPFDDFEAALKAAESDPGSVTFELSAYYFEHLLGEIARSANHTKSRSREEKLNDLYEYLQSEAQAHGLSAY
jgi:hypothetical protein